MVEANFCLIAGFCCISYLMKNGNWRRKGDDLVIFPDYNKKEDVERVKQKLQQYCTSSDNLIAQKSTKMTEVLTTLDGTCDQNNNLILGRKFWLGHEFIFTEHKHFDGNNAFVFFEIVSNDGGVNLMVHPFENEEINSMPSGGINPEGLKKLLSKPTPVGVSHIGHYFLAEIEGTRNKYINVNYQYYTLISICCQIVLI